MLGSCLAHPQRDLFSQKGARRGSCKAKVAFCALGPYMY